MKLEWENPTGSMKDRMAQARDLARRRGRSAEAGRHRRRVHRRQHRRIAGAWSAPSRATASGSSPPMRSAGRSCDHMAALGAELTLVPSEGGLTTKKLILDMIETARGLSQEPHTYWTNQLENHDTIAGYYPLGEEIWSQTGGEVDAFVHCGRIGGLVARGRHSAEATQAEHRDRRRRARGVLGLAGEVSRAPQDRGSRDRLRSSALGPELSWTTFCRSARATRRTWRRRLAREEVALRRNLVRRERRRRDSGSEAPRAERDGRHADGRLRSEVFEHRRVPAAIRTGPPFCAPCIDWCAQC